ncbi:MAG TPA: PilZ domain-containing protein, partial [Polyangia bacterium]
ADATRHQLDGVRVHWSGDASPGRVHDLSNHGVAFEVADADLERLLPGSVLDGLRLSRHGRECLDGVRAVVRHVAPLPTAHRYLVGCAWKPRAAAADATATPIRDRALCAALIKSGLAAGIVIAPLDDDARDGGGALALVGGRVDVGRGTISAVADGTLVEHDLVRGHFELGGALYRFTTVVVAASPLTLKLPSVLAEAQQRASARHRPRADEPLTVELHSPFDNGPAAQAVVDLSATGLSFFIDGARALYPIGLSLGVTLRLPDGPLDCVGRVRTLVREGAQLRCGIELGDLEEAEARRLANFVMRLRYPTVDDGSDVGVDELLEFFRATGFLYPEKEELLAPVMPEVRDTFARSYAQPSDVFKAVVAREDGELVGHVSGIRAYRNTWMPTHLAALPTKHVGHLLNLGAADYFLQTADFEYFKIYFHADSKWPARIFGGFARMQRDATQSHLRGYRHVMLSTDAPLGGSPIGIDVLEASPDDLAVVERHFVTREPGLVMRADDLTRQTLQLSELNRSFSELGLYRRRRVLMAMRRNVCVGFALAEVSSAGLNLSEALSAFQIFVTDAGRAEDEAVRRALLNAVLPIYRNAGRGQARGLIAPGEAPVYERLGIPVNEEQWMCWTYHRRLCPRFCDYVDRVFEVLRKRQRRG